MPEKRKPTVSYQSEIVSFHLSWDEDSIDYSDEARLILDFLLGGSYPFKIEETDETEPTPTTSTDSIQRLEAYLQSLQTSLKPFFVTSGPKETGRIYESMSRVETPVFVIRLWLHRDVFPTDEDNSREQLRLVRLVQAIETFVDESTEIDPSTRWPTARLAQLIADRFPGVNAVEVLDRATLFGNLAYNDWP